MSSRDWFPVSTPSPGQLVIVLRPRGGDWLAADLHSWKEKGVTTLVSLLTADDAASLELTAEGILAEAEGIKFVSYPIDDRGIPTDTASFCELIRDLAARVQHGETVALHCRLSIGRAPLTAIATLTQLGQTMKDAVEATSLARGRPVPETPEQLQWLNALAS